MKSTWTSSTWRVLSSWCLLYFNPSTCSFSTFNTGVKTKAPWLSCLIMKTDNDCHKESMSVMSTPLVWRQCLTLIHVLQVIHVMQHLKCPQEPREGSNSNAYEFSSTKMMSIWMKVDTIGKQLTAILRQWVDQTNCWLTVRASTHFIGLQMHTINTPGIWDTFIWNPNRV